MRLFKFSLLVLFCLLQYRLWFGFNGIQDYYQHREEVARHAQTNLELTKRNQMLAADVKDLKTGLEAIEERARQELGMIKQGETFFRIIPAIEPAVETDVHQMPSQLASELTASHQSNESSQSSQIQTTRIQH